MYNLYPIIEISLVHTICHFYDQLFHIGYYPIYSNRSVSVIMDILYVTALVLLSIHAALYQNIEWKEQFTLKRHVLYMDGILYL